MNSLIMLIAIVLFFGIIIAGLCFLGYFLYKRKEEKKEKRYEE